MNNLTEKEINTFTSKAIKNKSKISYIIEKEKYNINYTNKNKIIFKRESDKYTSTMIFILNKKTLIDYQIKDNNIFLEIEMLTKKIEVTDKFLKIEYLITDSNNEYEYYIEMSD